MTPEQSKALPVHSLLRSKSGRLGQIVKQQLDSTVVEWDDGKTGVLVFDWQYDYVEVEPPAAKEGE